MNSHIEYALFKETDNKIDAFETVLSRSKAIEGHQDDQSYIWVWNEGI